MKVDFPHPESAATPIMMGVWPDSRAFKAELEATLGLRAEGEKAAADAKRALTQRNFIVKS